MTKLIVAFRHFAKASKSRTLKCRGIQLRAGLARVSNPSRDKILFSSKKSQDRFCSPNSLLINAYMGLFPELKRPRRDVDHSPPPSADIKNEWS